MLPGSWSRARQELVSALKYILRPLTGFGEGFHSNKERGAGRSVRGYIFNSAQQQKSAVGRLKLKLSIRLAPFSAALDGDKT
jgi:hypothetical protein